MKPPFRPVEAELQVVGAGPPRVRRQASQFGPSRAPAGQCGAITLDRGITASDESVRQRYAKTSGNMGIAAPRRASADDRVRSTPALGGDLACVTRCKVSRRATCSFASRNSNRPRTKPIRFRPHHFPHLPLRFARDAAPSRVRRRSARHRSATSMPRVPSPAVRNPANRLTPSNSFSSDSSCRLQDLTPSQPQYTSGAE